MSKSVSGKQGHAFRHFRNTYLRNHTHYLESVRDFWLGWGSEDMSGHYDGIKADIAYRKDVARACGRLRCSHFIGFIQT